MTLDTPPMCGRCGKEGAFMPALIIRFGPGVLPGKEIRVLLGLTCCAACAKNAAVADLLDSRAWAEIWPKIVKATGAFPDRAATGLSWVAWNGPEATQHRMMRAGTIVEFKPEKTTKAPE